MGEIKSLDFKNEPFESQNYINANIAKATDNLIKDLVTDVDDTTLAVILSAIYFKSNWKIPDGWRQPSVFKKVDSRWLFKLSCL
jgi:serine protease inhibitor